MHKAAFQIREGALDGSIRSAWVTGWVDSLTLEDGAKWRVGYHKFGRMWRATDVRTGYLLVDGSTRKICIERVADMSHRFYRAFVATPHGRKRYAEMVDQLERMEDASI